MNNDWEKNQLWRALTQRNVLGIVVLFSLTTNAIQATEKLLRDERTMMVPSAVSEQMWASRSQVSGNYLEAHALDVTMLVLNVTPATAKFNKDVLLRMAHPSAYGALDRDLTTRNARLQKAKVSTSFQPGAVTADPNTMEAVVGGTYTERVGTRELPSQQRRYLVRFEQSGGLTTLVDFKFIEGGVDAT